MGFGLEKGTEGAVGQRLFSAPLMKDINYFAGLYTVCLPPSAKQPTTFFDQDTSSPPVPPRLGNMSIPYFENAAVPPMAQVAKAGTFIVSTVPRALSQ